MEETPMNALAAFEETLIQIGRSKDADHKLADVRPCSKAHFSDMHSEMIIGQMHSELPRMSEGKMNRWLGWLQGVACARGILTLDEVKEINHRHRDET